MVLDLLKKVVFIPGFMAALLDLGVSSFQTNPLGGVKGGRSSRMKWWSAEANCKGTHQNKPAATLW